MRNLATKIPRERHDDLKSNPIYIEYRETYAYNTRLKKEAFLRKKIEELECNKEHNFFSFTQVEEDVLTFFKERLEGLKKTYKGITKYYLLRKKIPEQKNPCFFLYPPEEKYLHILRLILKRYTKKNTKLTINILQDIGTPSGDNKNFISNISWCIIKYFPFTSYKGYIDELVLKIQENPERYPPDTLGNSTLVVQWFIDEFNKTLL